MGNVLWLYAESAVEAWRRGWLAWVIKLPGFADQAVLVKLGLVILVVSELGVILEEHLLLVRWSKLVHLIY